MTEPVRFKPRWPARKCPICASKAVQTFYPFCCKRCADIDLGRWLGGDYAIRAEEADQPPANFDAADDDLATG
jgi:uncharacterized protein